MTDFNSKFKALLKKYRKGKISEDAVLKSLKWFPFYEKDGLTFDTQRIMRRKYPEFIYAPGKDIPSLRSLISAVRKHQPVIITRLEYENYKKLRKYFKNLKYNQEAGIGYFKMPRKKESLCAVVSAGRGDLKVAEEASFVLELLGINVARFYDLGCAGLVRLITRMDEIEKARCIIAVAGMEGALPGILAGLVSKPVIAVPTSVGYGTSLGGFSALLTMLNSCSLGLAVVNIDNGIGAATVAYSIIKSKS
jgi:hypothetical protein